MFLWFAFFHCHSKEGRKEEAMAMAMEESRSSSSIFILVVSASLILSVSSGLQFDIGASEKKCFTEELNTKGLVLANYHLVSDNTTKISSKESTFNAAWSLSVLFFFLPFTYAKSLYGIDWLSICRHILLAWINEVENLIEYLQT